jgi:hypothetical protein
VIKRFPLSRIPSGLIIALLATLGVFLALKITSTQSSLIPESAAVERALLYAQEDGPIGGAAETPVEIRGQVLPYGQAVQIVFGTPISSKDANAKIRDELVWLIILQGRFVEHVPSSADGSIPPKDSLHTQMVIILDGNSGELIEQIMISPQKTLPVNQFPVLTESTDTLPSLPTEGLISTEIPYPTLSP